MFTLIRSMKKLSPMMIGLGLALGLSAGACGPQMSEAEQQSLEAGGDSSEEVGSQKSALAICNGDSAHRGVRCPTGSTPEAAPGGGLRCRRPETLGVLCLNPFFPQHRPQNGTDSCIQPFTEIVGGPPTCLIGFTLEARSGSDRCVRFVYPNPV